MFKYTEAEIKSILKEATVVIDTREQKCGHITVVNLNTTLNVSHEILPIKTLSKNVGGKIMQ